MGHVGYRHPYESSSPPQSSYGSHRLTRVNDARPMIHVSLRVCYISQHRCLLPPRSLFFPHTLQRAFTAIISTYARASKWNTFNHLFAIRHHPSWRASITAAAIAMAPHLIQSLPSKTGFLWSTAQHILPSFPQRQKRPSNRPLPTPQAQKPSSSAHILSPFTMVSVSLDSRAPSAKRSFAAS